MKKVVSVVLAVLMLCSLVLVASAATPRRWSIIDLTYASATKTLIRGTLETQRDASSLKITAQVYRYSSVADDYMRSVKFEESDSNINFLVLNEPYTLYTKDKVVFTFYADGETHTETCYVR